MAAEVEVLLSDSDLEEEDEDESQWFDNTLQLAGRRSVGEGYSF